MKIHYFFLHDFTIESITSSGCPRGFAVAAFDYRKVSYSSKLFNHPFAGAGFRNHPPYHEKNDGIQFQSLKLMDNKSGRWDLFQVPWSF